MPEWRNGRRSRLKIVRGQPHESSSLSSGTNVVIYMIDDVIDINEMTNETYIRKLSEYKERTRQEVSGDMKIWIDTFADQLPIGANILELGSATGRDARYLRLKGFKVCCTDVVPEALTELEQDGFETFEYDFRNEPKQEWLKHFDGFFANAVLLHAPDNLFRKTLIDITKVLKKDGVAAFTLMNGKGEEIKRDKMNAPRYFNYHTEEEIRKLLSDLPFQIISLTCTDGDKWLNIVLKTLI